MHYSSLLKSYLFEADLDDQTPQEEFANTLSHGLGLVLSIVGLVVMGSLVALQQDKVHTLWLTLYGIGLIALYGMSTLYHSLPVGRAKRVCLLLDHCAIYIFIAACYSPLTLVALKGAWGLTLTIFVWVLALLGVLLKIFYFEKSTKFCLALYLIMGWMITTAIFPLSVYLQAGGTTLLILCGVFYTAGVPFFMRDSMPFNHVIWHGFVMAGTLCHYLCVLNYIL